MVGMFWESIKQWEETGVVETKGESEGNLEGYTLTKLSIDFYIKETNKKIANCLATGMEEEDVEINYY